MFLFNFAGKTAYVLNKNYPFFFTALLKCSVVPFADAGDETFSHYSVQSDCQLLYRIFVQRTMFVDSCVVDILTVS